MYALPFVIIINWWYIHVLRSTCISCLFFVVITNLTIFWCEVPFNQNEKVAHIFKNTINYFFI